MNERTQAFFTELKALFEKHQVTIQRENEYDGHDEFCAVAYSFVLGGSGRVLHGRYARA